MATYVISDIHGEYEKFKKLLKKIYFSDDDTLYILGDVLDRGDHPIKVLQYMMDYPNIYPIAGNHEVMAVTCLRKLMQEISEENIEDFDENMMGMLLDWQSNGGDTTIKEFTQLDKEEKQDILDYLDEFTAYEEVCVAEKNYLLVHAGLGNFHPKRSLDDYSIDELVWERPDYTKPYFKNVYTITGHTPTQNIKENPKPGYIYQANNHIAIDCGAVFGGQLAAYCLDTGNEYYIS